MYKNKTKLRNKIFSLQKNYVWTYTISIFLENETSIKKKYSMFPLSCIYNYLPQKLIKFILLFKKKKKDLEFYFICSICTQNSIRVILCILLHLYIRINDPSHHVHITRSITRAPSMETSTSIWSSL